MERQFLVCFHDISVWNFRSVQPILSEMKDFVGEPFSLLVIPDTEKASEGDIAEFKETLAKLEGEGFEFALHGYKHKAEFSQGRNYLGLAAMNITHREAEFAGLSEYESSRLLSLAIDSWKNLSDKVPAAFVPPTWWSNAYLPMQVRNLGLLYEDRFSMTNQSGKRYASPVTSYAGMPNWTLNPMSNIGELLMKVPAGVPRIAMHPVDFPQLRPRIKHIIRAAFSAGRTLAHYRDL